MSDLIIGCSNGSQSAFHEQLLTVLPALRRQAMRLTRNHADMEDLVHATVANALAAQNSFEVGTNFHAWMARILRNRFLANIRRPREMVALEDAPDSHLCLSGSQEESIDVQDLWGHVGRLSADQRSALLLVSVQGLSYDKASESLGVPVATVKNRVFRAREQLRALMFGREVGARRVARAPC